MPVPTLMAPPVQGVQSKANFAWWEQQLAGPNPPPRERAASEISATALGETALARAGASAATSDEVAYKLTEVEAVERPARQKAEALIGMVATTAAAERPQNPAEIPTLRDAAHRAKRDDPMAHRFVKANVSADCVERIFPRAGHVTEVELEVRDDYEIIQHGQTGTAIQENSLRGADDCDGWMISRKHAETRNNFRYSGALEQGIAKDNWVVLWSCLPTEATPERLADAGFFVPTMTVSIQGMTLDGKVLRLQSAFVAGKLNDEAPRHDIPSIVAVGKALGIDVSGMSVEQLLDTPWVIPRRLMPNGMIDLVRLYDKACGGFYGQDVPAQDYIQHREVCRKRELTLKDTVQEVTDQLIARADEIVTDLDATELLDKLCGEAMARRAVRDKEIDPQIFGPVAAGHIYTARRRYEQGDVRGAEESTERAAKTQTSSSCPGLNRQRTKSKSGDGSESGDGPEGDGDSEESGECEYRGTFCYCCPYNDDGSARRVPMEVTIRRKANGTAYCQRPGCGASLSANGSANIGNIARKAETIRRLRQAVKFVPVSKVSLN